MPSVTNSALAGTVAGFAEALAMHPSDVIKTRFQARAFHQTTMWRAVWDAARLEGALAFYKGISPTVCTIAPKVALQMGGLAFFKPRVQGYVPDALIPAATGILTGIMQAVVFLTPAETVKVRQQVEVGWDGNYRTMLGTMGHIARNEGIVSFYQGLSPTILRQSWGLVIKFSGYEGVKALLSEHPGEKLAGWKHAAAGGVTNIAVAVLNSPPDVVKTRMQEQSSTVRRYKSSWECCKLIMREEGPLAFFRGSTLRIVRIAPGGALQFGIYGIVCDWLEDNH